MSDASIIKSGMCGENLKWTMDSIGTLTICGEGEMEKYHWSYSPPWEKFPIKSVVIKPGVTSITSYAFRGIQLSEISIPESVIRIDSSAFYFSGLSTITLPNKLSVISNNVFEGCERLTSIIVPPSVTEIDSEAFFDCKSLKLITLHENIKHIAYDAFDNCIYLTIICHEGSYAHHFCEKRKLSFIFDYQFEAFQGILPPGIERLTAPFPADEEKPFIFVSYSHKDRDRVLDITKTIYEAGWKIWYDEGLTIGDKYDETLEEHVKSCTAFLLFISSNSVNSNYVIENEIPWAQMYGKPIIKCILDKECDYIIEDNSVIATVTPSNIEDTLKKTKGLLQGETRVAKGISVIVNPTDRSAIDGGRFAYCIYSTKSTSKVQAILLEARNSGCIYYDATKDGEDSEKLQSSACLIVFIDKSFLSNGHLVEILSKEFLAGKDIAVCQIDDFDDSDIPNELADLHKMQWLNYVHGATLDLNTRLVQHLQKRGCRDISVLPGLLYDKTDDGIIITKYRGMSTEPKIECIYGGIPVIGIAANAFEHCNHIKRIAIPDSVKKIGDTAFHCCTSLSSVVLSEGITEIKQDTFRDCPNLVSIAIPDSVMIIGDFAFLRCTSLTSITMVKGVKKIGSYAFGECSGLTSITLPDSITEIGYSAFRDCTELKSIVLPDSIVKIDNQAFSGCDNLVITAFKGSYAEKYAKEHKIPLKLI